MANAEPREKREIRLAAASAPHLYRIGKPRYHYHIGKRKHGARLEIIFACSRLEKALATEQARVRTYGPDAAKTLYRRMTQLHAAESLDAMRGLPGGCHELKGARHGQLAVDLTGGSRLVFKPTDDPPPAKPDGGLNWSAVTAITILEVTDYHG